MNKVSNVTTHVIVINYVLLINCLCLFCRLIIFILNYDAMIILILLSYFITMVIMQPRVKLMVLYA